MTSAENLHVLGTWVYIGSSCIHWHQIWKSEKDAKKSSHLGFCSAIPTSQAVSVFGRFRDSTTSRVFVGQYAKTYGKEF